jgi:hypothetical protein
MASVSPYLNPHISAESWRMKTTEQPYFIENLRRFIFWSHQYFLHRRADRTRHQCPCAVRLLTFFANGEYKLD